MNLFAYCGNNCVNYYDPTGHGATATLAWTSSMWWLCGVDFVLPIGDIVYGVGIVVCAIAENSDALLNISASVIDQASSQASNYYDGGSSGGSSSPNPNDPNRNKITEGKPHGSNSHKAAIRSKVSKMESSGQYSKIFVNKSLNTAGLNGTQRPDIIGILRNGGSEIYEYASKSQATGSKLIQLNGKMNIMINNNFSSTIKFFPYGGY